MLFYVLHIHILELLNILNSRTRIHIFSSKIDINGKELVPVAADSIYSIKNVEDENKRYFMIHKNKEFNVIERLIAVGLLEEEKKETEENSMINNTIVTNQITNSTVTENIVNNVTTNAVENSTVETKSNTTNNVVVNNEV